MDRLCLCGCDELDHAVGEGMCQCGCPAFRPVAAAVPALEAAQDIEDRRHDGAARQLLDEHTLTIEVGPDGAWVLLPPAGPEDADG